MTKISNALLAVLLTLPFAAACPMEDEAPPEKEGIIAIYGTPVAQEPDGSFCVDSGEKILIGEYPDIPLEQTEIEYLTEFTDGNVLVVVDTRREAVVDDLRSRGFYEEFVGGSRCSWLLVDAEG